MNEVNRLNCPVFDAFFVSNFEVHGGFVGQNFSVNFSGDGTFLLGLSTS